MVDSWESKSLHDWNNRAADWHKKSSHMWTEGSRKDVVPLVTKHLERQGAILDFGCGDGTGSLMLSNCGYRVTGIDISEEMIRYAKIKKSNSAQAVFQTGGLDDLQVEEESFDAVMCINSLEWTENPFEELVKLNRLVKKGGKIFCAILGPAAGPRANSFGRLIGDNVICNTMMPWEFTGLAKKLNWIYVEEHYVFKDQVYHHSVNDAVRLLPKQLKQSLSFFTFFVYQK
ncbi:class I SAM-dependent methyltransferase [Jeotgalibacillus sp. S-D1]|uniref:class I SAM-dependent methyltransferase n=1 Tax=Jeotgalibacillus sp. S-D1 TaxID=2552189 RepID=UPI001059B72C|nr:class I SAM-dependent methyltransferase [Jeotgalibacillus sp. S-D1]TDL34791.1 class I SAM-dependent methyltransferase [Jeotgalibacillus sp. S-D1]